MGKQSNRKGSSTRLVILVVILVAVGAGCIYEFSYARPRFEEAWEKIKAVDSSADSGEYTSKRIREMMGRDPIMVDEDSHEECVVQTYRWRSGLLVRNHDIHVVFTKLKPGIYEKRPDLAGKLYYFSASAGQPLHPDNNFPLPQDSLVINLNPPPLAMGGAPRSTAGTSSGNDKGSDDKGSKGSDSKGNDKKMSQEPPAEGADGSDQKSDDSKAGDLKKESADPDKSGTAEKSADPEKKPEGDDNKADDPKPDGKPDDAAKKKGGPDQKKDGKPEGSDEKSGQEKKSDDGKSGGEASGDKESGD